MDPVKKFFELGANNSILIKNNAGFSHRGPWKQVGTKNSFDRWYIGEISAAEYTISVDYNTENREILKCLIIASTNTANIHVYARSYLNRELVDVTAVVNQSYVDVSIEPKAPQIYSAKFIFTAQYFQSQNPITA